MKIVVAIIKPFKVDEVTEALNGIEITGVTMSEVRGFGRQRGHTEVYRGAEYKTDYIPKVRLDILVEDADVSKVVEAIAESAKTGKIGDGKIWTIPVDDILRIRTGDVGSSAL
jgi:nitrogen regulatory protein P-II 1